jgi:uncharacterized membrane protein (DUF485 family)
MNTDTAQKISQNPAYKELVTTRTRYGWIMTSLVLIIYFGFIYLVAFHKEYLAQKISENSIITYSIPVGIGVILCTVILTGIYVRRANTEFDAMTAKIKGDLK